MRLDFASLVKVSVYTRNNGTVLLTKKQLQTRVLQVQAVMKFLWSSKTFRKHWGGHFPRNISNGKLRGTSIPDASVFTELWVAMRLWGAISRSEEYLVRKMNVDKSLFTDHTTILSHNKAVSVGPVKDARVQSLVEWTDPNVGQKYATVKESKSLGEYRRRIYEVGLKYILLCVRDNRNVADMFMDFRYPGSSIEDLQGALAILGDDVDEEEVKRMWTESLFLEISQNFLDGLLDSLRNKINDDQIEGRYDVFDKLMKIIREE